MSITYDEYEKKSKAKQKIIDRVISLIEKKAKKNLEIRIDLNLPITKKEYISFMEKELPILKERIDDVDGIPTFFRKQIESLALGFLNFKNNPKTPKIMIRNNAELLIQLRKGFNSEVNETSTEEKIKFCGFNRCNEVVNDLLKAETLKKLKESLEY